jgi:glycosyltransferase involved in cell wall biosynthesis
MESRVIIAGGLWDDGPEIVERAHKSPYGALIRITGEMVPEAEVGKLFAACDVVTLPYRRASQSGVAALAMAQGKPIIATRVGGLSEALEGYEGTDFVGDSVDELAAALLRRFRQWKGGARPKYEPPVRSFSETARHFGALVEKVSRRKTA